MDEITLAPGGSRFDRRSETAKVRRWVRGSGRRLTASDAGGKVSPTREWLQEGLEQRGLPARGCDEGAVEECALAIAQRLSVRSIDKASRREQHRMACRRIPFARRGSARIDV